MAKKKRVLILCTGNSCRSQMAEGLWRALAGDTWEVASAGSNPAYYIQPLAIAVLQEIGIDISAQLSQHVVDYASERFDLVITVCDNAREACPVFPAAGKTLHWPFDDPTFAKGTDEERLVAFRATRDAIKQRIEKYLSDGV